MNIEEQLKSEILAKYKSVRAFTTEIGIPYSTLDSVFKRGIAKAGVSTMLKIFSALDLEIESIAAGKLTYKQNTSPNATEAAPEEAHLLDLYRDLNTEGQEKLVDYAEDLVAGGRYIKSDPFGMGKKEA